MAKRLLSTTVSAFAIVGAAASIVELAWPLSAAGQETHVYDFAEIQGNRIAWSCEGTGEPVIVLIGGSGVSAHQTFGRTYHNYRGSGRVCMYDRAGIGASSFTTPRTRNLAELTNELHDLIVAQEWGPVVLVPHSFGGFIARAYAARYADDVSGILFLDCVHEDWLPRLRSEMSPTDWTIMEGSVSYNLSTFHEDYYEAQDAVRGVALRSALPITVVSRGIPHTTVRVAGMSYDGVDVFNAEHNALQEKLVSLSTNAEHRTARYSSHMIDETDPWLVIEEIGKLVERVSSSSRTRDR
jgi:pimeloyl-ACP methyl ester carboxylesterase